MALAFIENMDKALDKRTLHKRRIYKITLFTLVGLGVVGIIIYLLQLLNPSVSRNKLITGVVERGNMQEVLSAQGTIEAHNEVLVVSPISASIQQVLVEIGTKVEENQVIMQLDTELLQMQYDQYFSELKRKNNDVSKLKLQLENDLRQIEVDNKIQDMKVKNYQAAVDRMQRLYDIGGETKENLEKSKQDLQIAKYEKQKLENEIRYKRASFGKDVFGENMLSDIQKQKLNEISSKINKARILSPKKGVITWIENRVGFQLNEGETVAKITDVSSFALIGKISERYADKLSIGMKVLVNVNSSIVNGIIEQINPTVENNTITFKVQLESSSMSLLKPNQEVAISIVIGEKKNVLFVNDGPTFKGTKTAKVYQIVGNEAFLKEVTIGLQSGGKVEILSGLKEGDEIILSDTDSYNNTAKIELK